MSLPHPDKPLPPTPPAKSRWSIPLLLAVGCGGVSLLCILICAGIGFLGFRFAAAGLKKLDGVAQAYEAQGYERRSGQLIHVNQSPPQKTLYVCQVLHVNEDVDVDIAAVCQVAEIKADVHANLDFFGQVLKVHPNCVIQGDVRVKGAQAVQVEGEVKGQITGSYQVLNYKGKMSRAGQSPSTPASPPAPQPPPALPPPEPTEPPTPPASPATPEPPGA